MSWSSSSTERAMIPEGRGFEKAARSVFLTIPAPGGEKDEAPEAKSRTAQKAAVFSPGGSWTRFTTALPLPCGPTSGTACTFTSRAGRGW